MVIVIGAAIAKPDGLGALLDIAVAHCRRSRGEAGCISHNVHVDAENPLRLVFVEYWSDSAALKAHFGLPESISFGKDLRDLSEAQPEMRVYDANKVRI